MQGGGGKALRALRNSRPDTSERSLFQTHSGGGLRLSGRKRPCVLSGSVDTCDRSDMRGGLATSTCSFTSGDAGELAGEVEGGVEAGEESEGEGAELVDKRSRMRRSRR